MDDAAIGERHYLLEHVVDGLAVEHAARAAGVVGHHAADGGAACGGNVGRKPHAQRLQVSVQLIEHDAGLDAHPALGGIHFQHAVVVRFEVSIWMPSPIAWPACEVPPPRMVRDS